MNNNMSLRYIKNNKLDIRLYCSIVLIKQLVFKILGPAAFSEHDPVYNAESISNPRIAWGVTQYYSHTAYFSNGWEYG